MVFGKGIVLVNKIYGMEADEVPENLTKPDVEFDFQEDVDKRYLTREAARALEKLFEAAIQEGIRLIAISGYRSYGRQKEIYLANVQKDGVEYTDRYSARAGHSEHQTGLAMDLSCASCLYQLTEDFAQKEEGKWLREHAKEHGFILRYPKGKENITGYSYEPWHVRYVGTELAKYLTDQGLVLEEYHNQRYDNQISPDSTVYS